MLVALITQAEQLHNRLVVVDVPPDQENADDAIARPAKCWSGSTDCANCWLMGS